MDVISKHLSLDADNSYYHNAKMLLTVYGRMLWKHQEIEQEIRFACDESGHDDILFALDALNEYHSGRDLDMIRNRLECREINAIMMSIIEDALDRVRRYPLQRGAPSIGCKVYRPLD